MLCIFQLNLAGFVAEVGVSTIVACLLSRLFLIGYGDAGIGGIKVLGEKQKKTA